MKKLVVLFLLSTLAFAESYKEFALKNGYETDYKTALTKAKKENKEIFFVLVANYCPWCKKLEKRKLSREPVRSFVKKHYVALILNRQEHNFPKQFESPVIPMIYIVDTKNEKIKESVMGYTQATEYFTKKLKKEAQ